MKKYDVIIVGAGHAGCEAGLAASRMGVSALIITFEKSRIGYTSCNPSIGGVGKGQLVKEIDALGGEMAKAGDASAIQFRLLNSSKGYAARSSRIQIDRHLYNEYMKERVLNQPGLDTLECEAKKLIISNGEVSGIVTDKFGEIFSKIVIITTGTFMNGTIHIGLEHSQGGRINEKSSIGLSDQLRELGLKVGVFKTGTPARLDAKSIDFSKLAEQALEKEIIPLSFWGGGINLPQVPCFITRTNEETHKIIRESLSQSPLYAGKIKGRGVRYCPSIEDKIIRFADKESHLIFIEPEGLNPTEYYPNGISTSLPVSAQERILHSIKGLENAKMNKPAYGIEYDYVDPTELYATLESKKINGLFIAGQVNGTTGYEEAGALGLMAGINAARKIKKETPIILDRATAYIGVLIDDLVTKGTVEPYRMFTSRVEYRLTIREDNADERLSLIGRKIGLITDEQVERVYLKLEKIKKEKEQLEKKIIAPSEKVNSFLSGKQYEPITQASSAMKILKRPHIFYEDILKLTGEENKLSYYEKVQLEVDVKYQGYISRELAKINRFKELENMIIPSDFDYAKISGLSKEVIEKLNLARPRSLGQASRISGITPAAITMLMVKIKR
ncbi:tRNA uridine 5-carboxymethylaminomethyl modification protein GidA [Candidatus Omnitrophus magneticus]|uniref:tRNA uridine 5-carboxymethylaminomethyl modification enzyme MnmG n=1 Tax=Candidatus Omnitrophus magneticus TaxID=1609969 RepID=A0A0F0CNY1_9BACT|nr:tRNA uridine 5-carboxymethylaminomethyl modification protein GidA [Candidatus Omnitrophus magneticus]